MTTRNDIKRILGITILISNGDTVDGAYILYYNHSFIKNCGTLKNAEAYRKTIKKYEAEAIDLIIQNPEQHIGMARFVAAITGQSNQEIYKLLYLNDITEYIRAKVEAEQK